MPVLGQIEAGAKVLAGAGEHDAAHVRTEALERVLQVVPQRFSQRIAFVWPIERDNRNGAAVLDQQIWFGLTHILPVD